MNEIYWAVYRRDEEGCAQLFGNERLSALDDIRIDSDLESGAGHGWLDERARELQPSSMWGAWATGGYD